MVEQNNINSLPSKEHWLERGKNYQTTFEYNDLYRVQEDLLLAHLATLNFRSVLEVGCGFGRITKLILEGIRNITRYKAIDLSPDQIENAKKYVAKTTNAGIVEFVNSDIQSLPNDERFDVVLACEVLMHIPPTDIKSIVDKLVSLSKGRVINVDWHQKRPPVLPHNYVHKYREIYLGNQAVREIKRIPILKRKNLFQKALDVRQSIFDAQLRERFD